MTKRYVPAMKKHLKTHQGRIRVTDSDRRNFVRKLVDADGEWIAFPVRPNGVMVGSLIRLGIVETKVGTDGVVDGVDDANVEIFLARITQAGRTAYENGQLTYAAALKSLQVPMTIYESLERIARELGLYRVTTATAHEAGSIVLLLRMITAREDAFKRWYKAVNAE